MDHHHNSHSLNSSTRQFVGFAVVTTSCTHHHHQQQQQQSEKRTPVLLQLATDTTAYLFRLRYDGMPEHDSPMTESLQCLLSDQQIIKIGFSTVPVNVRHLNLQYGTDCCGDGESFLELLPLARYRWPNLRRCGLRNITATVLRCQLCSEKQARYSYSMDWERPKITPIMEEFAASKAFVVLDLFIALQTIQDHEAKRMLEEQQIRDQIIAPAAVLMNAMVVEASMFEYRQEMQDIHALHEGVQQMHIASSSTASARIINNMIEASIDEIVSLGEKHEKEEVIDIPDTVIKTLPPYRQKEYRNIVVITCAAASEKAVIDIRSQLLQQHTQNGGNRVFNSYRFLGFCIREVQQTPVLLQMATISTAYLFRLSYVDMPEQDGPMTESLRCLLSDVSIVKIGIAHHCDVRTLNRVYGNDCCGDGASFLDLSPFINLRWPGISTLGVRNVAAAVLGYSLNKKIKPGLWRFSQTTPAMEERAGADVFVVLDLFDALLIPSTPAAVQNVVPPAAVHCLTEYQPLGHTRSDDSGSAAQVKKILVRHSSDIRDYNVIDFPKNEIRATLPRYSRPEHRRIVVITCASASDQAVSDIRTELSLARPQNNEDDAELILESFQFVGFDTETKPSFQKGYIGNPPALLQIATFTTAYLFRLKWDSVDEEDSPMTDSLQSLLSDPRIIKVGSGIHEDFKALNRQFGDKFCGDGSSYLDLIPLARNRWPMLDRCGLRSLTATVLRHNLSKKQQMSNWEKETMSRPMQEYAAADAFVALDLLAAIVVQFDGYNITIQAKDKVCWSQMIKRNVTT